MEYARLRTEQEADGTEVALLLGVVLGAFSGFQDLPIASIVVPFREYLRGSPKQEPPWSL